MAAPPDELPDWATDVGATITVPSSGFRETGYEPNTAAGAGVMNWWKNRAYQWLRWLKEDSDCAHTEATELLSASSVTVFSGPSKVNGIAPAAFGGGLRLVAVGDGGRLYTSDNGGASWTQQTAADLYSGDFRDVVYVNGLGWLAVGASGEIQYASNGTLWQEKTSGTAVNLIRVGSDEDQYITGFTKLIVLGANGVTLRSTDSGTSFSAGGVINSGDFTPHSIVYANGVWLAGGNSGTPTRDTTVFRSTDNGVTWAPVLLSGILPSGYKTTELGVVQGVFAAHATDDTSHMIIVSKDGVTWDYGAGSSTVPRPCRLAYGSHMLALVPVDPHKHGCVSYDCGRTYHTLYSAGMGSIERIQMINMRAGLWEIYGTRRWAGLGGNSASDDRGKIFLSRYFTV